MRKFNKERSKNRMAGGELSALREWIQPSEVSLMPPAENLAGASAR